MAGAVALCLSLPALAHAQGNQVADGINSLQGVLDGVYNQMIPLCSSLVDVGRGIGGFATLWYIAVRVGKNLANAEPIDIYPLLKPFVVGFAVINFASVISLINGVMSPTVSGTANLVQNSNAAVAALLKDKEQAVENSDFWKMYVGPTGDGDRDKWYKYTHPDQEPSDEGMWASIGNDVRFAVAKASYNFRNAIKEWMSEVLQILFAAASLCINTIRTFNLIILAIIGPLAWSFSIFDGFGHTLKHWLARYINIFLWLPVGNIFGAVIGQIQQNMLQLDLSQISQTGDTFFSSTDMAYLVFLVIGIIGYTTVPTIANHIIWVGAGDALTGKTTGVAGSIAGSVASSSLQASGRSTTWVVETVGSMLKGPGTHSNAHGVTRHSADQESHLGRKLSGK